MNATAITQAAAAVQKAERRHEYAIDALMHARNAGRPTRHLEAELLLARKEWAAAQVDAQVAAVRANADAYSRRLIDHAEWKARNAAVWAGGVRS